MVPSILYRHGAVLNCDTHNNVVNNSGATRLTYKTEEEADLKRQRVPEAAELRAEVAAASATGGE